VSTLARAFNRMTGQLKTQQAELIGANQQLDRRRRFTEAVLSGVSAGVLSIDGEDVVQSANRSASALLEQAEAELLGQRLAEVVPELAAWLETARETGQVAGEVRIARGAETQTLSVRIAADVRGDSLAPADSGMVLTFDDISAQLADQRRAAWADVARRIAHEIKNPLTPIQLAAERLSRRFGKQIAEDRATFDELTGLIVRQVGDLHRMVNEFSDFARLPRPVFMPERLDVVARDAVLLQQVAFPGIAITLVGEAVEPLAMDRQQIGRMFTNLLKNAGEAVLARLESGAGAALPGAIEVRLDDHGNRVEICIRDNGVGLPAERRDELTEPYVTTRARGTGLGLAIVKKIVEDHGGELALGDAPGGGAEVRVWLPRRAAVQDGMPASAQQAGNASLPQRAAAE
jgi:two-component system nitrogen regulation sensor histidine kinase NtrY